MRFLLRDLACLLRALEGARLMGGGCSVSRPGGRKWMKAYLTICFKRNSLNLSESSFFVTNEFSYIKCNFVFSLCKHRSLCRLGKWQPCNRALWQVAARLWEPHAPRDALSPTLTPLFGFRVPLHVCHMDSGRGPVLSVH